MILLTAAGFKAMQDDGAAVPGLSLLLHCQLELSEVFEERRMRQEQKQPPLKVLWGQQCPDTSLISPTATEIEGGTGHSRASQHIPSMKERG